MKHFAIAFGIVCAVAPIIFGAAFALLWSIGNSQAHGAAGTLAGAVILTFPKVAEFLEQQESKKRLAGGGRKPIYDFRGFQIAWPLMVVYGIIVLVGLLRASSSIGSMILDLAGCTFEGRKRPGSSEAVGLLNAFTAMFGAYLLGHWIGARASRLGIVTMALIASATAVIWIGADIFLISPGKDYTDRFGPDALTFLAILGRFAGISLCIFVPGIIGHWFGQKQRLSKYLNYLLNVLAPRDRDTVVEIAYGEAQRVAAAALSSKP